MKVLGLNCNNCGAPLEVPARARFASCNYCSARLQVHVEKDTAYTQVLETLHGKVDRIEAGVKSLRDELRRLDQEWLGERERYRVKGKPGLYRVPRRSEDESDGWVVAAVLALLGIGALLVAALGGLGFLIAASLAMIAIASWMAADNPLRARRYSLQKKRYIEERLALLRKIREAGSALPDGGSSPEPAAS